MGHPTHTYIPGGIYFASAIGEDGQAVFADESDRVALGEHVGGVIARCGARIHAFKWLEDELLAMVQVYGVSLSGVMQRITSVHARRVNGKLGQKGALFQHPHRAVLLEDSETILEALATIHRPPASPWSSHQAYLGLEEIPWLTRQLTLNLLSTAPDDQIPAYRSLIEREAPWKHLDLWQLGRSSRVNGRRPYDEFVAWLKSRSRERAKPASLDQLINAVARWFQIDPAAIESNATGPLLSLARALIVWTAMQNEIASLAELAQRFGRGRSTLCEIRESYRVLAPQLFNISLAEILRGPDVAVSEVLQLLRAARQKTECDGKA